MFVERRAIHRGRKPGDPIWRCAAVIFGLLPLGVRAAERATPETHPLMPGIRCAELHEPGWTRTLHDRLATGFSPLKLGMSDAPTTWSTIHLGGQTAKVRVLHETATRDLLLVDDGRLRLVTCDGQVRWTSGEIGDIVYFGDRHGRRKDQLEWTAAAEPADEAARDVLLVSRGRRLALLDARDGRTMWSHEFTPSHVLVRAAAADLLPDLPGFEAAVLLHYGEEGCLINFPPDGEPQFVWQRTLVRHGEYDERYDHGADLRLDQSVPERPIIWTLRRYRCRGFDARTGELVSSIAYEIGGEQRRNYGSWELGRGPDGAPLVCVIADRVQLHAHAIQLAREGDNKLAWQHYYGEVYKDAPGAAMDAIAITDVDGDGDTEMVYSICDPAREFRSFVRVRDAASGAVESELADHWGLAAFSGVGPQRAGGLLVLPALRGAVPLRGDVEVFRFGDACRLDQVGSVLRAGLEREVVLPGPNGNELLIRDRDEAGRASLGRYTIADGQLRLVERGAAALGAEPLAAMLQHGPEQRALVVVDPQGILRGVTWSGERLWDLDLAGGALPLLSAADLDDDGRAELVAVGPGPTARIYSVGDDGQARERHRCEHLGCPNNYAPSLYDLAGDGRLCLIAPGSSSDDKLIVRAYRGDGSLLWESPLDAPASRLSIVINAGRFLPGGKAAVAVSLAHTKRTFEGTYLLEGATGRCLWFKGLHHDGYVTMPYRPNGIPTAFDIDGDGAEEIGMDMLSYMAYLRGNDGSFAYLRQTPNIRVEDATYAGHLYNTYCPLYETAAADERPHWLVTAGFGRFGLMKPDTREGLWRVDLGYDVPANLGLIDVDGDGRLEVGYAALHSDVFVCRDAWTGEVEWELKLPAAPNSPTITADVDSDGRGEFLTGSYCIGVDERGQPRVRWRLPCELGWAAIADFDGDGQGEIACPRAAGVSILRGSNPR